MICESNDFYIYECHCDLMISYLSCNFVGYQNLKYALENRIQL